MSKAMVLFSGGVDSTTCLGLAIEKYGKENVIALSISYGQKHKKGSSTQHCCILWNRTSVFRSAKDLYVQ